jgi:transcriptional regulator with XRE-family HTH domain
METPGTILKREREARGYSLREISSITRIPMRALQNLEEDRYDLFPAEVFTRGFLRNYARELQVNCDDLLLSYNALRNQRGAVSSRAADLLPSLLQPAASSSPATRRVTKKSGPSTAAVTPSVVTASIAPAMPRRSLSGAVSAPGAAGPATATVAVDNQRTFRFAYLIVFLVVAGSLGLSIVFTGTGEAEEAAKRNRPIAGASMSGDSSRWMMRDGDAASPAPAIGAPIDTAFEAKPNAAQPGGPLVDDLDEEDDEF